MKLLMEKLKINKVIWKYLKEGMDMDNKITLRMNDLCFDNKELQKYLLSLKGIKKIKC